MSSEKIVQFPTNVNQTSNGISTIGSTFNVNELPLQQEEEYDKIEMNQGHVIQEQMKQLSENFAEITHAIRQMSSGNGGGGGMDDLSKRVGDLERNLGNLDNRMKNIETKLDKIPDSSEMKLMISDALKLIPNEDKVKNMMTDSLKPIPDEDKVEKIVRQVNKSDELASKTHVSDSINSAKNQMILWIIGTAIAIAGLIIKFH